MRNHGQKQWDAAAPAISLIASFIERGAEKLMAAYNDEDNYSDEQLDAIIATVAANVTALNKAVSPLLEKDV